MSQINEKYKVSYEDRKLTDFEKLLFNTDYEPNFRELDMTNAEILNSLSIYYDPHINPGKESLYIMSLLKLDKINDSRGALRLGLYYFDKDGDRDGDKNKEDIGKALEYTKRACELGNPYAYGNMYSMFTKDVNDLFKVLSHKKYDVIIRIVYHYVVNGQSSDALLFIQYGLYKQIKECLKFLSVYLGNDRTSEFLYISRLKFTNPMLEERYKELFSHVNHDEIIENRNKLMLLQDEDGTIYTPENDISHLIELYG